MPCAEPQVPSSEFRVPNLGTRNSELGTRHLIFETGQRYLSKMCKSNFLISSNFCPQCQVPNPECRVPGPEIRNSELRTRNSELRTRHLIFETGQRYLSKMCKSHFLILSNFCPECQVPNPEFRVPNFGTRNSELRTRDLIFETGQRYLSKMCTSKFFDLLKFLSQVPSAEPQTPSSEFQISGVGTRHSGFGVRCLALGTWDKNWRRSKTFHFHIFDRYLRPVSNIKSRVPSSEFRVPSSES
jgi:hypothetical protein